MKNIIYIAIVAIIFSSCAGMFPSGPTKIKLDSEPTGATVFVKGEEKGETPLTLDQERSKTVVYDFQKDGYLNEEVCIYADERNNWVYLNAISLYIGSIVDASAGNTGLITKTNIAPELTKIPEGIDSSQSTYFNGLYWPVEEGDTIAISSINGKQYGESVYEERKSSGNSSESSGEEEKDTLDIEYEINRLMSETGIEVPSAVIDEDESYLFHPDYSYKVIARIEDFRLHQNYLAAHSRPVPNENCLKTDIQWSVINSPGDTVYQKIHTTEHTFYSPYKEIQLYRNVKRSYLKLLGDADFREIIQAPVDDKANMENMISLNRPVSEKDGPDRVARSVYAVRADDEKGTAIAVSAEGYLITSHNLTTYNDTIVVIVDEEKYEAEIVRRHAKADICLLKIDADNLSAIPFDSDVDLETGMDIFAVAMGGTDDFGVSLTQGIISSMRQSGPFEIIQTDVSLNYGNNGGALITKEGQLIGIINAKISAYGIEGIGFGVPAHLIGESLGIEYKE
ncbi:MAG: trypsin-like peptidase domain-containing protein [Bacteroidales bacterium]